MYKLLMLTLIFTGVAANAGQDAAKVARLRAFLGYNYAQSFRNDTCENAKDPQAAAERVDAKALAAAYFDASAAKFAVDHYIYRIYLTSTDGIRYVEVSKYVNGMAGGNQYYSRADGKSCSPVWTNNDESTAQYFNPQWDVIANELIIKTNPEIHIRNSGFGFSLTSSEIPSTIDVGSAPYMYPANAMPYCDTTVYCDRP